jgi:hypothetical protein
MEVFEHSPAPWTVKDYCLWDADDKVIANFKRDTSLADAVLIAAAPALKKALIECLADLEDAGRGNSVAASDARQALGQTTLWK